jgi:hypothetical protein
MRETPSQIQGINDNGNGNDDKATGDDDAGVEGKEGR